MKLKDKIYLHKDVVDYLVSKGIEKGFVECFLEWMAKEITDASNDPEIVDIRIPNLGSLFYTTWSHRQNKKTLDNKLRKGFITNERYEVENAKLEERLENVMKTMAFYNEDNINGSKYKRFRIQNSAIKNG